MELREALANGIGRDLSPQELDHLIRICAVRRVAGGDTIMRQTDKTSDVMVVLSGGAVIEGFNRSKLREAGEGSTLGEVALVDEQPRSASVRAVGPTELAILPSGDLRALLDAEPAVAAKVYRNIGRALCSKLRQTTVELDNLVPLLLLTHDSRKDRR